MVSSFSSSVATAGEARPVGTSIDVVMDKPLYYVASWVKLLVGKRPSIRMLFSALRCAESVFVLGSLLLRSNSNACYANVVAWPTVTCDDGREMGNRSWLDLRDRAPVAFNHEL